MSEIKAGDLVMVVAPLRCCGEPGSIGKVFRVADVWRRNARCLACGAIDLDAILINDKPRTQEDAGWHSYRLIRIDPPAQDETTEAHRELTA